MAGLDSKSCIDWCGVTVLAGRDGAQLSNGSQKPASPPYNDVSDGPSSLIRTFEMFPSVVQASALRDRTHQTESVLYRSCRPVRISNATISNIALGLHSVPLGRCDVQDFISRPRSDIDTAATRANGVC
ncbi:hypothetical protein QC764_0090930 [Podospora pseudoanserina]|uniref:Uncharacterized protein n=1 Tax=Podospora pseudoanserina TaxID=2609844 RepID=A0ABR0HT01_9PEZI|nr:hypothetical protein QC764_0090930 [Podospora pseudoanserina]